MELIVRRWFLGCALFLISLQQQARGCQYTVRDIGFVDLQGPQYTLVVTCAESLQGELGDWGYLDDCNVRLLYKLTNAQRPGEKEFPECLVELVDNEGRRLRVGKYQTDYQRVAKLVFEKMFGGQTMTKLREQAIPSFAQIILLELGDSQANQQATQAIEQAVVAIKRIEPMLPRPLARPVEVVRLSAETLKEEPLLAWCLNVDPNSTQQPVVAVIYGRGKLAGKILREEIMTTSELLSQLALVGESCECETDRSWNEELVLPGFWPAEFRRQASSSLGFDPESPLVQAEIARILERGPTEPRAPGSRIGDGVDDIEQLLLGYEERMIARGENTANSDTTFSHDNAEQASSDVAVVLHSGDGWDFAEADADSEVAEGLNLVPAPRTKDPVRSTQEEPLSVSTKTANANVQSRTGPPLSIFYGLAGLAGTLLVLGFVIQRLVRS